MANELRIMTWNANGLKQHLQELEAVLVTQKIDVCLISETHFTKEDHAKIRGYHCYHSTHLCNTPRGGSAVFIKQHIQQYEEFKLQTREYQVTAVKINTAKGWITLAAIYIPPRHNLKRLDYSNLLNKFKGKYIIGGDFNAKNLAWGSNLTTTKGRELLMAIKDHNCEVFSTSKPTYWPTDVKKVPDLIDFFVTKNISCNYIEVDEEFTLSSDHSPIVMTLSAKIIKKEASPTLTNKYTDWNSFRRILEETIQLKVSIKNPDELEIETQRFIEDVQRAAWTSTPKSSKIIKGNNYPKEIRNLIAEKRKIRKKWQLGRNPTDKTALNTITNLIRNEVQELKQSEISSRLQELTDDASTDYSLWKMTKKIKRPIAPIPPLRKGRKWAKSNKEKADMFAEHLEGTFQPYENRVVPDRHNTRQEQPIPHVTPKEVKKEIKNNIKTNKAPGFDLINGEMLKQLPKKAILKLTHLFNSAIRQRYVPRLWKCAEVIMIQKPGKDAHDVKGYRPISLLPVVSKLFEKLILKRLKPIIEEHNLIPSHQFGFRNKHSTLDQVHRIIDKIEKSLEEKKICATVFLDVEQAFDRVWHEGLFYKLDQSLPIQFSELLKSYLSERYFRVKQTDAYSELKPIKAGVPQGSVLGPLLYLLYTNDLPQLEDTTVATFADDTAIMVIEDSVEAATRKLQSATNRINTWANTWQIKLNESKSKHLNFTNKKIHYIPLKINEQIIPHGNTAKYLGMTLDVKLRWKEHVKKKLTELRLKYRKLYWLIGRNSSLSIYNKALIYKQILKPVWTYGAQLWGCTKPTNVKIIQTYQNKVLRNIVNAPWYIRNSDIHRDLQIEAVDKEIKRIARTHTERLHQHPNTETHHLLNNSDLVRRLKRTKPHELVQ